MSLLPPRPPRQPRWVNLYGGGKHKEALNKDLLRKMNRGAVEGTYYRGRVLVAVTARILPGAVDGHTAFSPEEAQRDEWRDRWFPRNAQGGTYQTKLLDTPLIDKTTRTEFSYWDPINAEKDDEHTVQRRKKEKWRSWTLWIHLLSGNSLPVEDRTSAQVSTSAQVALYSCNRPATALWRALC